MVPDRHASGPPMPTDAGPGSYLTLTRTWAAGDTIDLELPFGVRTERALDIPSRQSLAYGPVPMVIGNGATSYLNLSFSRDIGLAGDLRHAITPTGAMTFATNGFPVAPFYLGTTEPYHGYFTRVEPRIVFGAVDSGVPNHPRGDGLSFLDVVWDNAPFRDQRDFVRAVAAVSSDWLAQGLFTRAERQQVLAAAARSDLPD
jgi:hypothetical protein